MKKCSVLLDENADIDSIHSRLSTTLFACNGDRHEAEFSALKGMLKDIHARGNDAVDSGINLSMNQEIVVGNVRVCISIQYPAKKVGLFSRLFGTRC